MLARFVFPALLPVILAQFGIAFAQIDEDKRVITWPEQYQLSWQIDLPYMRKLQKDGLTYTYKGWQDTKNERQKTTRDDVESVIEFVHNNTQYQIYPRINEWGCRTLGIAEGKGPNRRLLGSEKPKLTLMLPDVSEERWKYNGTSRIGAGLYKGISAILYIYSVEHNEGYGETVATYKFYVAEGEVPLRLSMWGQNLYTEGHFDEYNVDFFDYQPGKIPDNVWAVPDMCPKHHQPENQVAQSSHWLAKVRAILPNVHYGNAVYDVFSQRFGRRHASQEEYASRMRRFQENKQMIEEHNAKDVVTHKLGVNHFADWSREEYWAVMLPNRGKRRPQIWPEGMQPLLHDRTLLDDQLPQNVDWRGSGADSPVKDQAMCGSCWAFGAVGSLEAAYFRKTGTQKLLSEQMLMDCAWDAKDENKACMGGFQPLAFQWLFPDGSLASEESYPYKGVTDFCRNESVSGIHFQNAKYIEVKGGEKALMEAIYTKGPMTVSVDAAPHSFAFYKSGIYTEETCSSKLDKLDHAVIVSGYGTTEDGQDYWLVKNTWSTYWGDAGYLKISRQPHDCGIATQPIYVEFDLQEPASFT